MVLKCERVLKCMNYCLVLVLCVQMVLERQWCVSVDGTYLLPVASVPMTLGFYEVGSWGMSLA